MINHINKLSETVDALSAKLAHAQSINKDVSSSNVAWHIQHCLMVIISVIETIKASDINNYRPKYSFPKFYVLATGKIPRGKARAPKAVTPTDNISIESLNDNILLAKQKLAELNSINKNKFFTHPFFGDLKLVKSLKFINIHTTHHLNIINDIIK